MTFLSPLFGWAFLSLIPLAAVYLLKVRPRKRTTTAYFLWEKILAQKQSSALFSRLRDLWSLLLLALAFCAVVLALMNPEPKSEGRKDLLIAVDHSASMSATESGTSRLYLALEKARGIVRALDGTQRAAVAMVAQDVEFVSHLTDSPREWMEALAKIKATDLPFNADAVSAVFADESAAADKRYRTVLISDGSNSSEKLPEGVELLKVGDPTENIGIVGADAQVISGSEPSVRVYLQLSSSYKAMKKLDVVFRDHLREAVGKIIPLEVEPGVNPPELFTVEGYGAGRYEVILEIEDALMTDNHAVLAPQKSRPVEVSVADEDRFFFENSVAAFARSGGLLKLVKENAQLAIGKGSAPDAPLSVVFQPKGTSSWWTKVGSEVDVPLPEVLVKEHPILRLLDAGSISFLGARELSPAEGALILVETDQGVPLIYVVRSDGQSAVVVNMDPVAAEFYYSAWFPVLIHGAATYLAGREEELLATYPTGARVTIPGSREGELTQATSPAMQSAVEVEGKTLGPLKERGFYELKNSSGNWPVAVSLLAAGESALDNSAVVDTSKPLPQGWSPGFLLVALAIIVLCIESILYHRRRVG